MNTLLYKRSFRETMGGVMLGSHVSHLETNIYHLRIKRGGEKERKKRKKRERHLQFSHLL